MSIELGSIARDQISGFKGMVTAQIIYATGCVQYKLDPVDALFEGKVINGEWFDESRLDPIALENSVAVANDRVLRGSSKKEALNEMGGPVGSMPLLQHP